MLCSFTLCLFQYLFLMALKNPNGQWLINIFLFFYASNAYQFPINLLLKFSLSTVYYESNKTYHIVEQNTVTFWQIIQYHNFEMPSRLSNLTHNRHQRKRKHQNNFIISRLGLFLDEPLFLISSGREELRYMEITSFSTKNKKVFVFVGLHFRRGSSFS